MCTLIIIYVSLYANLSYWVHTLKGFKSSLIIKILGLWSAARRVKIGRRRRRRRRLSRNNLQMIKSWRVDKTRGRRRCGCAVVWMMIGGVRATTTCGRYYNHTIFIWRVRQIPSSRHRHHQYWIFIEGLRDLVYKMVWFHLKFFLLSVLAKVIVFLFIIKWKWLMRWLGMRETIKRGMWRRLVDAVSWKEFFYQQNRHDFWRFSKLLLLLSCFPFIQTILEINKQKVLFFLEKALMRLGLQKEKHLNFVGRKKRNNENETLNFS